MKAAAAILSLVVLFVLGALMPGVAGAADRIEGVPPFYAVGLGYTMEPDPGWVIRAFYRSPTCVPQGVDPTNMNNSIDPDCPALVDGFYVIEPGSSVPILSRMKKAPGKLVAIYFMGFDEFVAAQADGKVTLAEMEAMDSLIVGWADSFLEVRQPIDPADPTGEFQKITEAAGSLEDGRSFRVHSVQTRVRGDPKAYNVSLTFGD